MSKLERFFNFISKVALLLIFIFCVINLGGLVAWPIWVVMSPATVWIIIYLIVLIAALIKDKNKNG